VPAFTKETAGHFNHMYKVSNSPLVYNSFLLNFVKFYILHGKIMLNITLLYMDTNVPMNFGIAVVQIQIQL